MLWMLEAIGPEGGPKWSLTEKREGSPTWAACMLCFVRLPIRAQGKGTRYLLETLLTLLVLTKVCGEDKLSGVAEWDKHSWE